MAISASFDCSKANTMVEIEICNTAVLSQLDEEIAEVYFSLNEDGHYFNIIKSSQRKWIKSKREANEQNLTNRLEFLLLAKELNNCTSSRSFRQCEKKLYEASQNCQERRNYTTNAMNFCGSLHVELLELVEPVETSEWRRQHADDMKTVKLFDLAYDKWKDFVSSDCDWQYSEFRDGTMRGQIWRSCMIGHYSQRISQLSGANAIWR